MAMRRAATALVILLLGTEAAAARGTPLRGAAAVARRLLQYPFPKEAYDRRSMAGAANGARAGGLPDPIWGLANPDRPALGQRSASMEGALWERGDPRRRAVAAGT